MSKKAEEAIEKLVLPLIENMGFEYVGTEITKTGDSIELVVYADKKGGLNLDDCEQISKKIDPEIEKLDPIVDGYCLCVSSPGLDRPLKTERDYKRSIGKTVDVKLYKALNGLKLFTGELKGFDSEGFTLISADDDVSFSYKDTAIVRLHIDIN